MLLFAVPLILAACPGQAREEAAVTVYFANWDIYSDPDAQVKMLPWDRLDCINHAFWKIHNQDGQFSIVPTDAWADTDPGNPKAHFPQYADMVKKYPNTDVFLSIGGWTCSGQFSAMCLTAESRASFIRSCLDTLTAYPFLTGLDLDWEYPGVARNGGENDEGNPVLGDDRTNFTLLLKELRQALDRQFGEGNKRLTICAGASERILSHQDYAALHLYVDRINLMTYDLAESRITGHHAPLYGDPSADSAVRYLEKCGVPEWKVAIGSPLYSHGWRDTEYKNAVGVPGKRSPDCTRTWKNVNRLEAAAVPSGTPGWHAGYDEQAQAAFLWNDDPPSGDYRTFLTYENRRSLTAKAEYVLRKNLGGVIVWESGGDGEQYLMLTHLYEALHQ